MKKIINKINLKKHIKDNILLYVTLLSLFINGFILRVMTIKNYFEFKPFFADFGVLLLLLSFYHLIKKKRFLFLFIMSIFLTAVCVINSMYFTFYDSFASFSLLATSMQISDVSDALVKNVLHFKDFIFIWQPIFLLVFYIYFYKKRDYKKDVKTFKYTILSFLSLAIIYVLMLTPIEINRFCKLWNREFSVSKFGIYLYQINDIVTSIQPKINVLFGYDTALKRTSEFYENRNNIKETNEYTNIFENKNVIMIHAESIQQFVMDLEFRGKKVAPNLDRLAKEGLYFNNFYSQVGVGTSSDTEFTIATSLLPVSSGTVAISYWNREFVSLQKLLKDKGYYTFSMHGNNGDFWNRKNLHNVLGYDTFYHKEYYDIDETIGLGLSDKSFFRQSIEMIKEISLEHENYFGTLITLSNHVPFDDLEDYGEFSVEMDIEYVKNGKVYTKAVPYMENTLLGNYFKSVRYADEALGEFIDGLDKEGLLENTIVVIYGDHDARLPKSEYDRLYNYDPYMDSLLDKNDPNYKDVDFYTYELNRKVPLIIYTKDSKIKKEINDVMGMYDVMPTLGNMLGVYNEYALGNDIFSTKEKIVVFSNGNWMTNKIYYNNQKREYLSLANEPISEEYIENNNKIAEKYIEISNDFIIYDYFKNIKEK